jgi:hypothetical protein
MLPQLAPLYAIYSLVNLRRFLDGFPMRWNCGYSIVQAVLVHISARNLNDLSKELRDM